VPILYFSFSECVRRLPHRGRGREDGSFLWRVLENWVCPSHICPLMKGKEMNEEEKIGTSTRSRSGQLQFLR
jgi:hypothetical protein